MREPFQIINEEEKMPRAILVGLRTDQTEYRFESAMHELEELAKASGLDPVMIETQRAASPVQATYIGKGKAEEIAEDVRNLKADLVIFDQTLSPMQFRNLGKLLETEVMDRTGLILKIFSEQAQTREARLQVEHAQLQYLLPRLAGMWTHFGRQAGASGSMSNRGVGEKQIELDRRHIERRMAELSKELKDIDRERATQREKRLASDLPRIALAGYTNAGKSTLMNRLLDLAGDGSAEEKKVLEKDKLFATLDTTVRKIVVKGRRPFLLSDTVGFINELPHSLVKAFRSTLEEVRYADLILEVIDFSDPDYRDHMAVTEETLREIGAGTVPVIHVYNKTDLVEPVGADADDGFGGRQVNHSDVKMPYVSGRDIYISAGKEIGLSELLDLAERVLQEGYHPCTFLFPYSRGDIIPKLQETATIEQTEYLAEGVEVHARCSDRERDRYREFLVR